MKFLNSFKSKNLSNKTVLLRVDFNIEMAGAENNPRVAGIIPTIKFLAEKGAKVVILSHRGRPKNNRQPTIDNRQFSLKPFVYILYKLLKKPVYFSDLKNAQLKIKQLKPGSVLLLENLRFYPGEDKNDKNFAKKMAALGDFYVNDAFSVSHRANASVAAITNFLPSYAGPTLEKEIKNLSPVLKNQKKPLIVILGGVKISTKMGLIKNFRNKADYFLIGSAMADNFLFAQGLPIGDSIYEKDMLSFTKKIMGSKKIILPADFVIQNRKILDIGPKTEKQFAKIIKKAKTIIWNGPIGQYEISKFAKGTYTAMKAILKNKNAKVIIGGGETIAALQAARGLTRTIRRQTQTIFRVNQRQVSKNPRIFISTGGGAMLEYLSGKKLPGVEALE